MQISQLPASSSFSSSDVIAIEIDGVTYKLTGATLATALQSIGGPLSVANGGTGADTVQGARVALGNAAHTIFKNYPQSAVTSNSNTDVNIVSTSVALPAGTYLVIAFAYVHQSAGSGRLKFKYGSSSLESVVSDGAAGETVGINAVVLGTFTSDGTAQTAAIAINSGNANYTMTAKPYMQYMAVAIRI